MGVWFGRACTASISATILRSSIFAAPAKSSWPNMPNSSSAATSCLAPPGSLRQRVSMRSLASPWCVNLSLANPNPGSSYESLGFYTPNEGAGLRNYLAEIDRDGVEETSALKAFRSLRRKAITSPPCRPLQRPACPQAPAPNLERCPLHGADSDYTPLRLCSSQHLSCR